tara:strand:- start:136 stop:537 length:402 start_codon:yes stop_codon:yes gene_type:complete
MKKALFTKKDGAVVDLSKIELNFGELDLETQKALKAWLHGWEINVNVNEWEEIYAPSWNMYITYRAIPAPKDKKAKKKSEIWMAINSKGFVSPFSSEVKAKGFARFRSNSYPCNRIVAIKRIKYRPGDGMEDV